MPLRTSHKPVGGRLDQMPVVADQDDRAVVFHQCVDQRFAAIDVEMVGRLVEDQDVRAMEGRQCQQQPRFLTARKLAARRIRLGGAETERAELGPPLRFRRLRHQLHHVIVGRRIRLQVVELMLREIADVDFLRPEHVSGQRRRDALR